MLRGYPLQQCARVGCLAGGAVVQSLGAELSKDNWRWLFARSESISSPETLELSSSRNFHESPGERTIRGLPRVVIRVLQNEISH